MNQNIFRIILCLSLILVFSTCGDDNEEDPAKMDDMMQDDNNMDDPPDPPEEIRVEMLISSRSNHSVKRFNGETGEYIDDLVSSRSGGLGRTQEVLIGIDGQLIVSGRDNSAIKKYDIETGEFLGNFTSGFDLDEPVKMRFGRDSHLYVSQWGQSSSSVVRFDGETGEFIDEVTPDLNLPMGQFFKDSILYVVSFGSKDVRMFHGGEQVGVLIRPGRLLGPVNLRFFSGQWLVEDWEDGTIKRFDEDGNFVDIFIEGLVKVEGIAFGPDGSLYACDWGQSVIRRYNTSTGDFIDIFARGGGLSNPNSILFRVK